MSLTHQRRAREVVHSLREFIFRSAVYCGPILPFDILVLGNWGFLARTVTVERDRFSGYRYRVPPLRRDRVWHFLTPLLRGLTAWHGNESGPRVWVSPLS